MAQTARAARMCRRTHPAWPLVEPRVTLSLTVAAPCVCNGT